MNLADYLSELLGQQDEVSVPGLGYFVRERVSGSFNEKENKFYPPYHKVKFIAQYKDDDTFAQYVADKKNISLASSKYFAEKFISKLREEAAKGKYLFADLGLFQTDSDQQLIFKPHEKIAADPDFYGFPPVDITRLTKPSGGNIKSVYAEPAVVTSVVTPPPVQLVEQQQYFEEETERKKKTNIWLIILIILAVIALAVFGIYKFYPTAFDKINETFHKITGKKADTVVPVYRHEIKADTIKKIVPAKDTLAQPLSSATATGAATTPTGEWKLIAYKNRQKKLAMNEVKFLQNRNVQAEIVPRSEIVGPIYRVSVGTFSTEGDAEAEKTVLVKAGKIDPESEVIQITPQQ